MSKLITRATIEELTWQDVRKEVAEKNPALANIIDEINPNSEYTLFKACYPFGSEILKEGHLFIPNRQGELVPLMSDEIPAEMQDKLGYNRGTNPVSIILKNTTEIFMILEKHTIPLYGLVSPGKIFSAWYILNPQGSHGPAFLWDMTAGARSIFMLPKVSETIGYNRLRREFHLQTEKPKHLLDHWKVFKEIVNQPDFKKPWITEILFFSQKWFSQLDNKKWREFHRYLLKQAWENSEFFRHQFTWDLVFSLIQQRKRLKPNPYVADTVKHLLAMGAGALPGFAAALDDQAAPVRLLQEVFSTIYQLTDYAPIIMQPTFFSWETPRAIYYSLQYPTTLKFSPRSRQDATKIFNLYEIKLLLSKYLADLHSDGLNISGTPFYNLSNKVQYDFFHTDIKNYTGLRLSKEIPVEDSTFTEMLIDKTKYFPTNSTFIRGCIRITAKC